MCSFVSLLIRKIYNIVTVSIFLESFVSKCVIQKERHQQCIDRRLLLTKSFGSVEASAFDDDIVVRCFA